MPLAGGISYEERCLIACRYFVTREITLKGVHSSDGYMKGKTQASCIILTSLSAEVLVRYGHSLAEHEQLSRGQTMILPAALGNYCIEGTGTLMFSYVPSLDDEAWQSFSLVNDDVFPE